MLTNIFMISLSVSTVILPLLLLTAFFQSIYSARWRYFLWLILALRLIIPFRIELPEAPVNVPVPPDRPVVFRQERIPSVYDDNSYIESNSSFVESEVSSLLFTLQDLLLMAWALGAGTLFLYHIVGYFRFKGRINPYCRPADKTSLNVAMEKMKINSNISLAICPLIKTPMMTGFVKPVILLPDIKYTPNELEVILTHELTHYKRGDLWYKLLLITANSAHWFNPLVWLMVKQSNRDLEYSCDDEVLKNSDMDFRKHYSLTILKSMQSGEAALLSTHFSESGRRMKKRFENILNTNAKKAGILMFVVMIAVGVIAGTLLSADNSSEYALSESSLRELAMRSIGSDMAVLDYADDKKVIFHYANALIVYSLDNSRIQYALDLSGLNVPLNPQGDTVISVWVTSDGKQVIISSDGTKMSYDSYVFDTNSGRVKKIRDTESYRRFEVLSAMESGSASGWSSINCIWLSENRRCYLLLKDGFYVSDIKIVIEEDGVPAYISVFENSYANAADTARRVFGEISDKAPADADFYEYIAEHKEVKAQLDDLIALDKAVLPFLFYEFENNNQLGIFREGLMMYVGRGVLGNEDINYTAARGIHWYHTLKSHMLNLFYSKGESAARNSNPKASMVLDYAPELMKSYIPVYYKPLMDYIDAEYVKAFSPYYDLIEQIPSDYQETVDDGNFEATFFYKSIYKNYYNDPDTVEYIKEAKARNEEEYRALYEEYNQPKETNYQLRVTATILQDNTLDTETIRLYTNSAPKGTSWEPINGFLDFIGGN